MRRISLKWLSLTSTIACVCISIFAGSTNADQICDPICTVSVNNSHPHEPLLELTETFDIQISVEGDLHKPISIVIEDTSVDQLVRRLGDAGGYLVGQQGNKYVFFGRNVEEVTIVIMVKHLAASEAGEKLKKFEKVDVFSLPDVNAVVVRGNSESVHRAKKFLQTIDYERPNVFLELLVVEYFHGNSFAWGYDIVNGTKGKVADLLLAPGSGAIQGKYDAITGLSKSFQLNLTALVEDQDARVVTNPHVAVRSGQLGKLDFQEEMNIILTNSTESFGTTRKLEKLSAGVTLDVTPNIMGSGLIDLKVKGEISNFVPSTEGQFTIERQVIETDVLVKSGETLVIAGLIAKQVSVRESGVPGLRRIPFLGLLFKGKSRDVRFVESVIYITPYIDEPSFFLPENIGKDVEEQFEKA